MVNLLADYVVRFNGAQKYCFSSFYVPYSSINLRVTELLLTYGCINTFNIDVDHKFRRLRIKIVPLYVTAQPFIRKVELISRPGLRIYWSADQVSTHYARNNFQGFYVISTSSGLCTSNELVISNVLLHPIGGEILLKVNL